MTGDQRLRLRRESGGFALGSACFLLGALPFYQDAVGVVAANVTFVIGAVFFTLAAFIQLTLSGRRPPRRTTAWPDLADWWSAAVQFAGTLFFNLSTIEALVTSLDASTRVGDGWRPDAIGSICFLLSGFLAVAAATARDRLWDPEARAWRCTWLNLAGSVFFGISAVGAYVVPATASPVSAFWTNVGTALGALCFLVAALLSRRAPALRPV